MTGVVTFHVPENKLAKLIKTPGGKPVVEAVADAQQGLMGLQDDCLADLGQMLVEAEGAKFKGARGKRQSLKGQGARGKV